MKFAAMLRSALRPLLMAATSALPLQVFAQDMPSAGKNLTDLTRDPAQWVMAPHDYGNTRFSPLDQINTGNVGRLQLAWTFSVGVARGQEAAPLIVDNVMYV